MKSQHRTAAVGRELSIAHRPKHWHILPLPLSWQHRGRPVVSRGDASWQCWRGAHCMPSCEHMTPKGATQQIIHVGRTSDSLLCGSAIVMTTRSSSLSPRGPDVPR